MFNPKFDEARLVITRTQDQTLELATMLNALNPAAGGPGLSDPAIAHRAVSMLAVDVHNIANALANVIDILDQEDTDRAPGGNS